MKSTVATYSSTIDTRLNGIGNGSHARIATILVTPFLARESAVSYCLDCPVVMVTWSLHLSGILMVFLLFFWFFWFFFRGSPWAVVGHKGEDKHSRDVNFLDSYADERWEVCREQGNPQTL